MPFVAMADAIPGTIASSSQYNKVVANVEQLDTTRTKYKRASASSSSVTVTETVTDLPGASVSVTTVELGTQVEVTAVFDVESSGTNDIFLGTLVVDGAAAEAPEAHYRATGRATITQSWLVSLGSIGAHTLKLQVAKVSNANTILCYGTHTHVTVRGQGVT